MTGERIEKVKINDEFAKSHFLTTQWRETKRQRHYKMPVTEQGLRERIESAIPQVYHIIVTDLSYGCGQSFDIVVVSDFFQGKNKLMRSRAVNKAVKEELQEIHAFSCKCYTEEEWSKIVV
ncbi:BolA-like protein 2 [Saccharomyces cerevisiae]|uniref:K7_Ygl220wp n=2 Tax=Saccharomyces cerevisiae TaxID=4932 RepID=G2WDP1_YEASK|nr:Fra2p [Saccharomyces cerevisiae YJM195]AJR79392.1 Fra2p [Saccharomyces cerevisiae YJM320]AJR80858.1 Fra2p [Saccharomyces cerevisiae YJM450]AJR81361.1 Fra2p [Saccharomyces cerevisiae YJM451]AJR82849.1 Fra2p [Saccharomyces cerevisiae YJM470]AJR83342.1 Fra2p [Saccharomyces cerevisiae YJM541]AJR85833.1 Fra2p [Saccharomyces cerevisiae YJM682]AJR86831.1 Fra2p [Saccharomyces cerevisiae YJM689]AJR93739.1 Fra2p [Saccharomyces cerevisiae YJM1190]AJR94235.1 Fra2p [Saccharomyces cerevisiae YJM1199]